MRKLVVAVALLIGVIFIITQLADVEAILATLQRGDARFILLAVIVEVAWILNMAATYRAIYRALGMESRIEKLLVLSTAANFLNVVTHSGGVGGMALFISQAGRNGFSRGRVTIASVLYVLFDYAAFICVLTLGLFVLFRRNNLNLAELIASGILVLAAVVIAALLYLGMRSAQKLGAVLAWMARAVNRILRPFLHRDYLSETRAREFAHDAAEGLHEVWKTPTRLLLPASLALISKALLVSILFFLFLAFRVPLSAGTLIAAFSIAYLFFIVSPTPSGLGFVEGALTLALRSMYVPWGDAAVIALTYCGITFWLPLLVGMISFRWIGRAHPSRPQVERQLES